MLDARGPVCDRCAVESSEEEFLRAHRGHDIKHVLQRWQKVAQRARLQASTLVEAGGYPVVGLTNRGRVEGPPLYLSTGVHGDEPGAVLGLLEWAERSVERLRATPVLVLPCVNPWGLVHNTRVDQDGRDLNRSFDHPEAGTVRAILQFIGDRKFDTAVSLHEDYDANGAYLYELARGGQNWGEQLMKAVEGIVPRHRGAVDGRRARRGVIRRTKGMEDIIRMINGAPEAIHLYLHHARMALTFETPSEFSLHRRALAHAAFVERVMELVRE